MPLTVKDLADFISKQYIKAASLAQKIEVPEDRETFNQIQTHIEAANHAILMLRGFSSKRMLEVIK